RDEAPQEPRYLEQTYSLYLSRDEALQEPRYLELTVQGRGSSRATILGADLLSRDEALPEPRYLEQTYSLYLSRDEALQEPRYLEETDTTESLLGRGSSRATLLGAD
ncbi:uncharacterized protein, partial [Montipora foliosa]|uniref:uncharacterized protein n=1 Tax=Montipora foliosa TaxID=591990 RepID=UPI0035F12212